jgi:hypothetical protein
MSCLRVGARDAVARLTGSPPLIHPRTILNGGPPLLGGSRCEHCCTVAWTCGASKPLPLRLVPMNLKTTAVSPSGFVYMEGSGQFGTPWERMHRVNGSSAVLSCSSSA